MTAHRSPTKSRRPLSSVPAGQPPGMRLSRKCRLSEAPNAIEGYGQPSSAITGQKKTLTFGPQVPENQHCPRQPLLNSEQHRSSRPKYRQKPALPSSAITELRTTPISKAHVPQEHASPSSAITELRKTPIFKHKIPQEPAVNPRQPLLDSGTHSAPSPRYKKSQLSTIVSHCWTKAFVKVPDTTGPAADCRQPVLDSGICWWRGQDTISANSEPLSAITDSGKCSRPGYHGTSNYPSSAITGVRYMPIERPRYGETQGQHSAVACHYRLGHVC